MKYSVKWVLFAVVLCVYGCCQTPPPKHEEPPPPMVVPPPPVDCCQKPPLGEGQVWNGKPLPTGYNHVNPVCLEKFGPEVVAVGQMIEYQIKVTNCTDDMFLGDVTVTDRLPDGFKFDSATPAAQPDGGGRVVWNLGDLKPRESKAVQLRGTSPQTGELIDCASVDWTVLVCIKTRVVSPKLQLTKTTPAELIQCDPIPVRLVVVNPGDGPARNVKVTDNLPEGWTTEDGKTSVTFDAGTLAPGQAREFTFRAKAMKTGTFTNNAVAVGDGGLKAETSSKTVVKKPRLSITKTGRKDQYIFRSTVYEISIKNEGDGDARDTIVEDVVEGNARILAAPGGAITGNRVMWNLGTLAPNETKKLTVEITSDVEGMVKDTATAKAYCADAVTAVAETMYKGIPALLLEVVDLVDPVEVGTNTTYVITVTNQGSMPDTNIELFCHLEDQVEFVSADGVTPGACAKQDITFQPLPSLAPKAEASWRVVVKAKNQGDIRFHVRMESKQLGRPVEETESTNFYK